MVSMRDFARALTPFSTSVLLAGVAAAWVSAYWLPIRDPKFVSAPRAILEIGIYFSLLTFVISIASGAVGVWLCTRQTQQTTHTAILLVAFGILYAALPLLLDGLSISLLREPIVLWGLLLGFPAVATYAAISLTQGSFRSHVNHGV